jgi:hypothetical protein
MPLPEQIDTYHDLFCYQYARLIGVAAGIDDDGFLWSKYWDLKNGEIEPASITKEDKYQLKEGFDECVYCGEEGNTTFDHLIPISEGGPDIVGNQVPACQSCNSAKGTTDAIEWFKSRNQAVPRIVWGKYLKLTYERLEMEGELRNQMSKQEREKWEGVSVTRDVSERIRKRYRD